VIGSSFFSLFASKLDSESFVTTGWESVCKGTPWNGILTLKRKNGASSLQQVSIAPGWSSKTDKYLTVVSWDITKEKIYEENMKRETQQALEASRLKSEFLTKTSHDIRVQLTGITGMCELLKTDNQHQEIKELAVIEKSANHLLILVNDILDISQIGIACIHTHALIVFAARQLTPTAPEHQ
jgi:signal transduction histidine kinase